MGGKFKISVRIISISLAQKKTNLIRTENDFILNLSSDSLEIITWIKDKNKGI